MERLSINRIPASTSVGAGLSIAIVCGAVALSVGLIRITAADRLIDGGYDQAIARASARDELATGTHPGALRLANHTVKVLATIPTAATEHAWLTRPMMPVEALQAETAAAEPVVAPAAISAVIGASVGARFTVANADSIQTLEVFDVSEISSDQLNRNAALTDVPGKMLLVSCRIVGEVKSPVSKTNDRADVVRDVVRFIVDAELTHPVRLPRAL
jgi:hypothetical protein